MPDLTTFDQDLSQVSVAGRDLEETLHEITSIARRASSNADAVSITLLQGERTFTAAYDGQMALHADELQYERGYGPCLDAAQAGQVLVIDDMATEQRWPDYARKASTQGIRASLSVPLPFQSTMIGALNLYADRAYAFSQDDCALSEHAASWSALAVGYAEAAVSSGERLAHLRKAMASRAVIEQAKGILMERHKISEEEAFIRLSRASQASNVKLRDVADELVRTGLLSSPVER